MKPPLSKLDGLPPSIVTTARIDGPVGGFGPPTSTLNVRTAVRDRLRWLTRSTPRRFLAATVVALCAGVAGMLALSWYVNPRGNFGPIRYQNLFNVRQAKAEHLAALPSSERPQVIVLGSSTTMQFSPADMQKRLHKSAFNYGVFWGRAEDILCIAAYVVEDLGHRPDLFLVGLDTWTFKPDGNEHPSRPGFTRWLLNTPQLIRHHPDAHPIGVAWSRFTEAFSREHLALSWRLWRNDSRGRTPPPALGEHPGFRVDGTRIRYADVLRPGRDDDEIFEDVENGRYPITDVLRKIVAESRLHEIRWAIDKYDFDGLSDRRLEFLTRFLELCHRESIDVAFVIGPTHPVFYDLLVEHTPHRANLVALRTQLERWRRKYNNVRAVVDASHIDRFDGDADGFYDPYHPATRNCDRILAHVAAHVEPTPKRRRQATIMASHAGRSSQAGQTLAPPPTP